jgi:hypothetical protein
MSSAATASVLPHIDIATLYGPMSVLGPLNPAAPLEGQALVAQIDALERTTRAALSMEIGAAPLDTCAGEVRLAGDREEWQAMLETCRQTLETLTGTKARSVRRSVSSILPERAVRFIQLQDQVIAHYRQILAWLAFMLGEDDEMDIQRELVPTDEAVRAPSPSVTLELD